MNHNPLPMLPCRLQATEEQLTHARLELATAKARREALQGTRANLRREWDRITDSRCLENMKAQVGW